MGLGYWLGKTRKARERSTVRVAMVPDRDAGAARRGRHSSSSAAEGGAFRRNAENDFAPKATRGGDTICDEKL